MQCDIIFDKNSKIAWSTFQPILCCLKIFEFTGNLAVHFFTLFNCLISIKSTYTVVLYLFYILCVYLRWENEVVDFIYAPPLP